MERIDCERGQRFQIRRIRIFRVPNLPSFTPFVGLRAIHYFFMYIRSRPRSSLQMMSISKNTHKHPTNLASLSLKNETNVILESTTKRGRWRRVGERRSNCYDLTDGLVTWVPFHAPFFLCMVSTNVLFPTSLLKSLHTLTDCWRMSDWSESMDIGVTEERRQRRSKKKSKD